MEEGWKRCFRVKAFPLKANGIMTTGKAIIGVLEYGHRGTRAG